MSNRSPRIILQRLSKAMAAFLSPIILFAACAPLPSASNSAPSNLVPSDLAPSNLAPSNMSADPASFRPTDSDEMRLTLADTVRINVYGEPGLTGDFNIGPDGVITRPLIGQSATTGLTPVQLQAAITTALQQGFLTNPRVSVERISRRPFYILGEVNKPGEYPYSPDMTVLNAVAMAQGFTYRANSRRVFIRHAHEGQENRVPLTPATPVQPGDTLRIGERYF